ncbi:TIGR02680 family protein [Streptosporangium sp. NPDC006007]|uniref:TIGR02680 family protein n=1 Tax=Streptosporangium sp. NPDC006007 TaxID=3154575 RepID=UPI0033BA0264
MIRDTNAPVRRLPASDGPRFRLHRAGIGNVWQYDEQEFAFGDGRLLLRGKNGAGKSKAMEMLLPYLLDGDARALDATGTGRTTLAWLMLEGFEQTNRLGYLWVEFRMERPDGDRYLTLGAAVRASKSTKKAVPSFFVTPLRVGEELRLVEERTPLPVDRLREKVGPENVTDRAVEHRARVARELFGITDAARYRNLTQLLHRLRRPTVGDRIESGGLASLLSETLPGLEEEVVDQVARNLHDLDTVRDELGRLERTDSALSAFLTDYRGYLIGVLRRASEEVGRELDLLGLRRREAGDAVKKTGRLRGQEQEAGERLLALREEQQAARAELDAVRASDGYRSLAELSERRDKVKALRAAADTAFRSLLGAHTAGESAADRLADGGVRLRSRLSELTEEHRELCARAERAGVPVGHLGAVVTLPRGGQGGHTEEELTDPSGERHTVRHRRVAAVDTAAVEAALTAWREQLEKAGPLMKNRVRTVREVNKLVGEARIARTEADVADTARERLEGEAEKAADHLAGSREKVVTESGAYADAVTRWTERTSAAVGPDRPTLRGVRSTVGHAAPPDGSFAERTLPPDADAQAEQAARETLEPYDAELADRQEGHALNVARLADEHERLTAEKTEWERRADPEPPMPYHRAAERATGTGAPLYRLVDFDDRLPDADRAGLEAALEASGLLDAWIGADGVLLDPLTRDTLFRPGGTEPAGPTLAAALRPVPPPESGVTAEQVKRVLSAVALETAETTEAESAVHYDGSWRLAALRGRHTKDGAEYVGAAVRAETRRRRLTELTERITTVRELLDHERERLGEVRSWRRALATAWQGFPRARALAGAWTEAAIREKTAAETAGRAARAAREAADARTRAVAARRAAEATASAHDLPVDPEALSDVHTALRTLLDGLERLRRAIGGTAAGLGGNRDEYTAYENAGEARREAEGEYETRLGELRPEEGILHTLEETVGSAEAEILAREKAAQERIDGVARMSWGVQRTFDDLREMRIRAEEGERRRLGALADQEVAVIHTGGALRGALDRPEVVRGAGLTPAAVPQQWADEPDADTRTRIRALRELADAVRNRLDQPRKEVSDSALLNRHTELRDQLAGGYDAQLEEYDGIKVCRLVDDHGPHDVALVGERIAAQAAEARGRLTDREREVFQRFLTGELGDHLSTQVIAAANLVAALNDTLRTVRTSHGLGVELEWKLDADADADVRAAADLLRSPSRLRTREQTEQLREVLRRRIEDARRADPSAGYAAHLRTALDYRDWFRFHTFVVEDAAPGRRRRLTGRTGLSQGEQRVLSYLVLFAAAAAHFTTVGESAPQAPRLILLDDAFAKVDEPTHGRLGRILVDLDLDFVLTSERLIGNWSEVPALEIYECLRDPHVRGVATLHYTWNGHHRRLVSV